MTVIKYLKLPILALLVSVPLSGCNKPSGFQIGDQAPAVSLNDFNGKTVLMPEAFKGKVVLLRFWSIDCGFCDKKMLSVLEDFYQKYKDQGFIPVAVNESQLVKTDERLKNYDHLTYPMLVDEYGLVAKRFGVIGLPTTFVIDGQGIVRDKITGEAGSEEFEKFFTTILNKGEFYENGH